MKKKENNEKARITSCGCIVHRKSKVSREIEILLIKQIKDKNIWGIPKGRIDVGESFEDCAVRETKEETGIHVEISSHFLNIDLQLKNKDKTVVVYIAHQICENEPKVDDPDSEVAAAKWFSIKKLPEIQTYQQDMINKAVYYLEEHVYK